MGKGDCDIVWGIVTQEFSLLWRSIGGWTRCRSAIALACWQDCFGSPPVSHCRKGKRWRAGDPRPWAPPVRSRAASTQFRPRFFRQWNDPAL